MKTIDCRAFQCPHPVVETRKQLLAEPGTPLTVLVGDETAKQNVTRLASSQGFSVESTPSEGGYTLLLSPGDAPKTEEGTVVRGKTVVFVGSDAMGNGSDELGQLLMKNYLFTLGEMTQVPDVIFFVNAGVKLTCEASEGREALEKLACMGVDIASCGLCLDFYHLKEKLVVGRATNMLDIAESMQNAGRIIRP